tara:strand:+ start:14280 stop:14654 length:375 start_codon:yes stop_codon:yes gene_type:complete
MNNSIIFAENIRLWAHVGVLEKERIEGQLFLLNFSFSLDDQNASEEDDLSKSIDYASFIAEVRKLSKRINCNTIERFSEEIINLFVKIYGEIPIKIVLKKVNPPVDGFNGMVGIIKSRNWIAIN